ncbi:unnamed protein product [Chrysoparadoxa australica]
MEEPDLVNIYEEALPDHNMYALQRTGSRYRGDGVMCAVRKDITVLDRQDLLFKDLGGRVAMMLRLDLGERGQVLMLNTHLLFPHSGSFHVLRLREVRKLLAFVDYYCHNHQLTHLPVIMCGDFNGDANSTVHRHLAKQARFSCALTDAIALRKSRKSGQSTPDQGSPWISHINHNKEEVGVDFIWYINPITRREIGPFEPDWEEFVFQSTKEVLLRMIKRKEGPDEDRMRAAVAEVGSRQGIELSEDDLAMLVKHSGSQSDHLVTTILDGSSTHVSKTLSCVKKTLTHLPTYCQCSHQSQPIVPVGTLTCSSDKLLQLSVEQASLFPADLEQGVWPGHYDLSDHGSVTARFGLSCVSLEQQELSPVPKDHDAEAPEWVRDQNDGHYGLG